MFAKTVIRYLTRLFRKPHAVVKFIYKPILKLAERLLDNILELNRFWCMTNKYSSQYSKSAIPILKEYLTTILYGPMAILAVLIIQFKKSLLLGILLTFGIQMGLITGILLLSFLIRFIELPETD